MDVSLSINLEQQSHFKEYKSPAEKYNQCAVDGRSGCSQLFTVIKKAAMKLHVYMFKFVWITRVKLLIV